LRITRAGVSIVVLPAGRQRIENLVERYRTAIQLRHPDITDDRELFSVLLEPVLTQGSKPRIVIVPDGKLHLLPFDGLKDTEGKYVLESHVVTYAPSATVLYLLRTSRSSNLAPRSFLGVGGVLYSGAGVQRAGTNGRIAPKENVVADLFDLDTVVFRDLPGSAEEVISAARVIEGDNQLLLDGSATEVAFKALPLADFRIIHLAVHGVANTAFPDRAALVLGSSTGSDEDGLLQVREIRDLSLNTDLVTLSACDTGTGRLLGQEGIASLERAFLLAGARAVIASLWPADDTYTIALMRRMYEHLIEGADKGAALRQAKLDLLREFSDQALPIYWAGFTLVGDGSRPIFN
jgi:CHAT domain-containing protein